MLRVVDDKSRVLTSILIGNTIALLAADSLATTIAIDMGLPQAALWSTGVMAVVLLLFGEIIPKTLAAGDGDRWLLVLSRVLRIVAVVLRPDQQCLRLHRQRDSCGSSASGTRMQIYVTEEDIRALVNVGAEQRVIEEEEREMIHSVIEFGDTIVREVMTPRPEIVAVSIDDSPRRALDVVIADGYSKLPVYQESKDDIVGVVHDRELLIALSNGTLCADQPALADAPGAARSRDQEDRRAAARDAARQVSRSRSSSTNTAARRAS